MGIEHPILGLITFTIIAFMIVTGVIILSIVGMDIQDYILKTPTTEGYTLCFSFSQDGSYRYNLSVVIANSGRVDLKLEKIYLATDEGMTELRVTIGGNTTTIRVGGEVRIPRPGVWEVRWELLSGNVVLHSGSTTIHYYERVEEAPQHVAMVVADRFITVTTTDIAIETELLTVTTEVPRVDPVVALLSFIAGIALAGTPLVVLLIRRGGGAE